MAGYWLKVEHATPDKPEVLRIAASLGIDADSAFGKCFRVWRWFDLNTKDGNASGVTAELLDRVFGVTGLCAAMRAAGWLEFDDTGTVRCVHFERHLGQSAKARALTANRVALSRVKKRSSNGKGNGKGNGGSVTNSNGKVTPPALQRLLYISLFSSALAEEEKAPWMDNASEGFQRAWDAWVTARFENRKKPTDQAIKLAIRKIAPWGDARATAALLHSAAGDYQGIFESRDRPLFDRADPRGTFATAEAYKRHMEELEHAGQQ